MSQEYFSPKGKSVPGASVASDHDVSDSAEYTDHVVNPAERQMSQNAAPVTPAYMTVGSGATSRHAARLQTMLDHDSGYGGSSAGDEVAPAASSSSIIGPAAWGADSPMAGVSGSSTGQRQVPASAMSQLWYNQHRVALGKSITRALELLEGLQEMNVSWPAHYPSVQRSEPIHQSRPTSRPGFHQAYSTIGDVACDAASSSSGPHLRRSLTSLEDYQAESSKAADRRLATEPRLVTPQIAREFSILKLDLKLGALHQTELVHSLEKASVASLLDGKISTSKKHLQLLRDRIEDTSSKVLVTGDLNSGKSTFCNALLRRKVLPEDQQPCTAIFCEVLDARENSGIEEVHAVRKDAVYNRHDETTYDVYTLYELEKIVVDSEKYTQCKVYLKDVRTIDQSLLNNGVVDIALIDAPGLNSDTTKTTAIFARQEEIDVVVFVVSAANHFTQTAKEFILTAASEKAYLFIVVNGFDNIRDKERCEKMILDQVAKLSPATRKEASELVHFVSSNAIPMAAPPPGPPGGNGSGSSSGGGGGGDDPGFDDPKGKGKDKEKIRDFSNLEQSLRRFVLEKRARSKLAPARTYLMNILEDVNSLALVNTEVAQSELNRVTRELEEIEPQLESSKRAKSEISDQIDHTIEETCQDVYDESRKTINFAIAQSGEGDPGVPYPGLFNAFQYAEDLKDAMLAQIAASVETAEEYARGKTVGGVNVIKQLGILHLGNEYSDLAFRPDVMFRRKRDLLARQVDIPTELWDFIDWSTLFLREEKTGMALTVAGVVGTGMVSTYGQMNLAFRAAQVLGSDSVRRMIVPGIVVAGRYRQILLLCTAHPY